MRLKLKKREQAIKMQQLELDGELLKSIQDLGYKPEEIDESIKVPDTPINNLYQLLVSK